MQRQRFVGAPGGERPCSSLSSACLAANGVLSLLNLACFFLARQVERLALDFENKGGFTERLYKVITDGQFSVVISTQEEVLPFVRNPEALQVWSLEFFSDVVRRIQYV